MGDKDKSFTYLEVPQHELRAPEGVGDKFVRRVKENPLVPIGLIATIAILGNGIWQMRTGNQMKSQRMMRWRVLAQGFTVAALVGGVYWAGIKEGKKE